MHTCSHIHIHTYAIDVYSLWFAGDTRTHTHTHTHTHTNAHTHTRAYIASDAYSLTHNKRDSI